MNFKKAIGPLFIVGLILSFCTNLDLYNKRVLLFSSEKFKVFYIVAIVGILMLGLIYIVYLVLKYNSFLIKAEISNNQNIEKFKEKVKNDLIKELSIESKNELIKELRLELKNQIKTELKEEMKIELKNQIKNELKDKIRLDYKIVRVILRNKCFGKLFIRRSNP